MTTPDRHLRAEERVLAEMVATMRGPGTEAERVARARLIAKRGGFGFYAAALDQVARGSRGLYLADALGWARRKLGGES